MKFRFQPEWNRSQQVRVGNRTMTVSAAPFDVPSAFQVNISNGQVVVTCMYDFNPAEPMELAVESPRVRICVGKTSGRVMSLIVKAEGLPDAASAIRELAEDVKRFARESQTSVDDVRRSVHFGMFGQALPEMGIVIESKLKELRAGL